MAGTSLPLAFTEESAIMADFLVCIIESPTEDEIRDRIEEGVLIEQGLHLAGIPSLRRRVTTETEFKDALVETLDESLQNRHLFPVLHLSAHGNRYGIGLTDGTFVSWASLERDLAIINHYLEGELHLCISSCEGYISATHAIKSDKRFWKVLVGNCGEPTWTDTAIAFASFYHLLAKGKTVEEAVAGMRAASGNGDFRAIEGDKLQTLRQDLLAMPSERKRRIAQQIMQAVAAARRQ